MKKLIVVVYLSLFSTVAFAGCTSQMFNIKGKVTVCTTCCAGSVCNTVCN